MTDTAWIFPGQGSQRVGMGKDLAARSPAAAKVFDTVNAALDFPLSEIIFHGPAEALVSTANQQPALLATSIAYLTALKEQGVLPAPRCVAGHSLGEYTALVAAGALDLTDAARIVRRRGELMEEHGRGGMIAVLGLEFGFLEEIAVAAGVEVANFNAPGQVTLSGRTEALEQATKLAKAQGAKRVIPLPVNGAFHSTLMRPVADALRPLIEETPIRQPEVPLIANVDGQPVCEPDCLKAELLGQIAASVRWVDVVQTAGQMGVTTFYEVGPGKVLTGLVPRILPDAKAVSTESLLTG